MNMNIRSDPSGLKKKDEDDYRKEENLMKKKTFNMSDYLIFNSATMDVDIEKVIQDSFEEFIQEIQEILADNIIEN